MTNKKIRVGIIGLNPDSQWASKSHFPALKHLSDDFELVGVANSTYESALKTANALNIPIAFKSAVELIHSNEIDLVTITVKVSSHLNLVKEALYAGKHIYCEHPLGVNLKETMELAELASKCNVVAAVGTQMPFAPEVIYLERLIKENYPGRVLSTSLIGSGIFWSNETMASLYYMYDKAAGATMLNIPLAHTLTGFQKVLGPINTLKAKMISNFSTVKIKDTGEVKPKTAEDQIMIIGDLKSGAAFSIHYRAGMSKGTNFLWEINGTEGDIQVTGNLGHGQFAQLTIMGARHDEKTMTKLDPPRELMAGLPEGLLARNVANLYKAIAYDIRNNTHTAPSFSDSVSLFTLLNAIEASGAAAS
ncbi:oxidoreductase [Niastella vici]|uniref:Oxidoreductase n=1 Tax=Niastella vici TaxID=1703345 RepID=A0A1V9FG17_9BACT|nr:Gfo/Idh/MocA family oxidoreductase [Niastella vici]OQP57211.1 oxidoreductase [Niastella vici]